MKPNSRLKTARYRFLQIILALCLVISGLICMICAVIIDGWGEDYRMCAGILDHLAAALLVVGVLAVYEKVVVEREFIHHFLEILELSHATHHAGVTSVYLDPNEADFKPIVTTSRHLTLVFNDGKNWISNNLGSLQERFRHKGFETEVFLIDPDGDYVEVLARKIHDPDSTPEAEAARIRAKIQQSVTELKDLSKESKGELKIWHFPLNPSYAAIVGDSSAIVTMYTNSNWRHTVPVLELSDTGAKSSLLSFVKNDIDRMRAVSRPIALVAPNSVDSGNDRA